MHKHHKFSSYTIFLSENKETGSLFIGPLNLVPCANDVSGNRNDIMKKPGSEIDSSKIAQLSCNV